MTNELAGLIIQAILAIAAVIALRQLSLTKKGLLINSRRDSIRYATELIKEYLREVIPKNNEAHELLAAKDYKDFNQPVSLKAFTSEEVEGSEIDGLVEHYHYARKLILENEDVSSAMLAALNAIESFATPFVEGVADEKIGFKAVGQTYCRAIKGYYPLYCLPRDNKRQPYNYFSNTIELYGIWSDRIKRYELENTAKK